MTTTSLSIGTTSSSTGSITYFGGSLPTIWTDALDSTSVNFGGSGEQIFVTLGTFTLGTGRVKSWTVTLRNNAGVAGYTVQVYMFNSVSGALMPQGTFVASTAIVNTSTVPYVPGVLSQAEIDGLQLAVFWYPSSLNQLSLYEAAVAVTYAVAPTANITYPTGTPAIGTSSPTVTWTHAQGSDGGPQSYHEIKVFTAAQYGAGGFSPDTSAAHYASGVVTGSATSAVVGPLDNSTTFRVYVRTAQTVNGTAHWSAWDFEPFTTSYTPVVLTSVTPVATNASGYFTVTVARSSGTWSAVEVQRTDDGGATWVPVRGATLATTTNTFVTTFGVSSFVVRDYEAPNGVTVTYRARASTAAGTVGAWVSSSAVSWSSTAFWLKDPLTPALNVPVLVTEQPQPSRSVTQGVFDIIGSRFPVAVSDVRKSRVGVFAVSTRTIADGVLFEAALESAVKQLQFPVTHLWGSKYIVLQGVQEMYVFPNVEKPTRMWQVAYVEVAQPADDTDY